VIEEPVIISDHYSSIFGVLRHSSECNKLVILIPADIGIRAGSQRIYVQIARALMYENIASLAVDIPPNGDSFDNEPTEVSENYKEVLIFSYKRYIDKVIKYLDTNFNFNEYILLSFSSGCIPVLKYAEKNNYSKVIILSPDLFNTNKLNNKLKNINSGFSWLYETCKRLMQLNLAIINELNKIIDFPTLLKKGRKSPILNYQQNDKNHAVDIFNILAEHDKDLNQNQVFWRNYFRDGKCASYTERIIKGADHHFLGWYFKEEVTRMVGQWISGILSS